MLNFISTHSSEITAAVCGFFIFVAAGYEIMSAKSYPSTIKTDSKTINAFDTVTAYHNLARLMALLAIAAAVLLLKFESTHQHPQWVLNLMGFVIFGLIILTLAFAIVGYQSTNSQNIDDMLHSKKFNNMATISGMLAIATSIFLVALSK